MSARLSARFGTVERAGKLSLDLGVSDSVWLVEAGEIEIFATVAGEAPVAGSHVATLAAGTMVFGLGLGSPAAHPLTLIAMGSSGTRLAEISRAQLKRLARDPERASGLSLQVDGWLQRLASMLTWDRSADAKEELWLDPEIRRIPAGAIIRPRKAVLWLSDVAGRLYLLGQPSLAVDASPHAPFPLPDRTWLVGDQEGWVSCRTTDTLIHSDSIWEGLACFHQLFMECLAIQRAQQKEKEKKLLASRIERDRHAVAAAYSTLTSILVPVTEKGMSPVLPVDPLLAACHLVGQAQHITIRAPCEPGRLTLSTICNATRIRSRRVVLRGDWWRRDNGPLLGFRSVSGGPAEPVALLPVSPGRYELADSVSGTRTPVDALLAEGLQGQAYMFYTPLPSRPLTFKDLLRFAVRGRRQDLATLIAVGCAGGLLGLLLPLVTGQIVGRMIPAADRIGLLHMVLALIVAAVSTALFHISRSIALLRLEGKIDSSLQAAIWDRLLALPVSFFRRFTVGDLEARAMGINTLRELWSGEVMEAFLTLVFSLSSLLILFYYSWGLALVAILLITLLALATTLTAWLQLRHQRQLFHIQGKVSSLLFGLISGITKLRVAGAEQRAYIVWADQFTRQRHETTQVQRLANVQAVVSAVYGILSSLVLFAMVGYSATVDLEISEYLAFNAAFGQIQAAALLLITVVPTVLTVLPISERLSPILETSPEVDERKPETGELAGSVELSHVSFRYQKDGPLVLDDVSLQARAGEFIALVGPSGSGKSTCLRLILGFDHPQTGSVYFDDQDLISLDMLSVRRQIGVVLQHGIPLVGDVFSNIVGQHDLTIDDAWRAAQLVGLAEEISAMPMSMHTFINQRGTTFSRGQRQRLLIARAIVNRPRILLLDEATNALDNRTQDIVIRSLEQLKATRIVVAHRLSTIVKADRIYVLDRGRIVEAGTYQELIHHNGLFSRMAERQRL